MSLNVAAVVFFFIAMMVIVCIQVWDNVRVGKDAVIFIFGLTFDARDSMHVIREYM